jgi:hypothetical protein
MAQHISLLQNNSHNDAVTANPEAQRDTYFVAKTGSKKPENNVLINKGSWLNYSSAFPHANFIYTGTHAYCFWDTGDSQIAGVTAQDPNTVILIEPNGHAGNFVLTVKNDGKIGFTKAT